MSEPRDSYTWVYIFSIVLGVLAVWQLRNAWSNGSGVEIVVLGLTVLFCLGLLLKQKWALIGVCLMLLVGIGLYFTLTWSQPILQEDPSLVWPNLIKMAVGILLFVYIGRQRIEHRFF